MPIDLSSAPGRRTEQSAVTHNRDTVLPAKRNVETDRIDVVASVRNGRRGDGGAQEVRRILGMVSEAGGDLLTLQSKQHAVDEKANAAQAEVDLARGQVNPELEAKSRAYSLSLSMSRSRKAAAETAAELGTSVTEMLNAGADYDPTKGEHAPDLEDVNAHIDAVVRARLLGPDGKTPIDFGSPEANAALYGQIEALRPRILAQAAETIRVQEGARVTSALGAEYEQDLMDGQPVDIETYMARVPPELRSSAKTALAESAQNAATRMLGVEGDTPAARAQRDRAAVLLTELADRKRPDGTPSWSPEEAGKLREAAARADAQADAANERERREAVTATTAGLLQEWRTSRRLPSYVELVAMSTGENPRVDAEDVETLWQLRERVESDMEEDAREGSYAGSAAPRGGTRGASSPTAAARNRAGAAASAAAADSGRFSRTQVVGQVNADYAAGRISATEHDKRLAAAMAIPKVPVAVVDAVEDGAHYEDILLASRERVRQRANGSAAKADVDFRFARAMRLYYRGIRSGTPADAAYAAAQASMSNDAAAVGTAVQTARAAVGTRPISGARDRLTPGRAGRGP